MSVEWTEYQGIRLCPSLQDDGAARAVAVLRRYFEQTAEGGFRFTGGAWDSFDPSGTRAASADVFTADDMVSCALLSTPIGAPAALALLNPAANNHFSALLSDVHKDRDFVDEASRESDSFKPAVELFNELIRLPGIGMTRATKLLARKRPRLVPIVDSFILRDVFQGGRQQWQPLLTAFQAQDRTLWNRLNALHQAADLPTDVSTLRVFDVLSWMEGAGYADRIMSGAEVIPPGDGVQDDPDDL